MKNWYARHSFLLVLMCICASAMHGADQESAAAQRLVAAEQELMLALKEELQANAVINTTWGLREGAAQENLRKAAAHVQQASAAYEALLEEELPEEISALVKVASALIVAGTRAQTSIEIAKAKRETFEKSWNPMADEKPVLQAEVRARHDAQEVKTLYAQFKKVRQEVGPSELQPGSWQAVKVDLADAAGEVIARDIEQLEKTGALYAKKHVERAQKFLDTGSR